MWAFGLTELDFTPLGRMHWAIEKRLTLPHNGLPTASFRLRLGDPLSQAILDRDGDCLLKVYWVGGTTLLQFWGEIMDVEAIGAGGFYTKRIDRKTLVNQAYSLPSDYPTNIDVKVGDRLDRSRGLLQEVVPSDFENSQFRQAWADANVLVRGVPRVEITFDPSARDVRETLSVNAAGLLWRLQKRLMGTPGGTQSSFVNVPMDQIWETLLEKANDNYETGIQFDPTSDSLYIASVGGESAWDFKPLGEGYTETQAAKVPWPIGTPPTADVVASDGFSLAGGAVLHNQTEDIGGFPWRESGATGNFTTDAGVAKRSANTDASTDGRYAILDVPDMTDMLVGVDVRDTYGSAAEPQPLAKHVLARVDNALTPGAWIRASIQYDYTTAVPGGRYVFEKKLPGQAPVELRAPIEINPAYWANDTWFTMRLLVVGADWTFWSYDTTVGFNPATDLPIAYGTDADLAAGAPLEAGKGGIRDYYGNPAGSIDRYYDNAIIAAFTGPQGFDFVIEPIEPSGGKIGNLKLKKQIGQSKPNAIFEPGRTPTFPTDYGPGDWVPARAKNQDGSVGFGLDETGAPIEFRVYDVEVTTDEEGKETVKPTAVPT